MPSRAEGPCIRIEVQGLRDAINVMLDGYTDKLNDQLKKIVEEYCTSEHLNMVIQKEVQDMIRVAVSEEIRAFLLYEDGRKAIKEAVAKKLAAGLTDKDMR